MRRLLRHCAGILVVALCLAPAVGAQTVRGRVIDGASGEAVALPYVGLAGPGSGILVAGLGDADGRFELVAPEGGEYMLYVSRIGYESLLDGLFELATDGVVEVQVGLSPEPIALDEVVVDAAIGPRSPLELQGFYERAIGGRGVFLTQADVAERGGARVSDVFRQLPLIDVDESRPLTGSPDVLQPPALRVLRNGSYCSPTLYLDRHVVSSGRGEAVRPDNFVSASEVAGIEVYTRPSEVPVEFDEINNCGVILIWTRTR